MEKKSSSLTVMLPKEDLEKIREKAGKAGLSISTFCRLILTRKENQAVPDVDVGALIFAVRQAGDKLDRILSAASASELSQSTDLEEAVRGVRAAEKLIFDTYTKPWLPS